MCSGKCVIAIKVMASAVVFLLVFAMAVYNDQNFRVCGYDRHRHLDNDHCSTFADVLENCSTEWTESSSSGLPAGRFSVRLLHTDDLIAVSDKLKDILNHLSSGLSKLSLFPILISEAQPQRHFHRIRWQPYGRNGGNNVLDMRQFPRPLPRVQPARDQQVPDVDDAVIEPPPERSHDHVVPVVAAGSLLRRDEQPWEDLQVQVVPGAPSFGQNGDRAELPPEEPSFRDLEIVQVVPQADDGADDPIPVTDRQEVNDPFMENVQNFFHLAAAALPWIQPVQPFLLPANHIVQEQLERFRIQSRVLEAMTLPVLSL